MLSCGPETRCVLFLFRCPVRQKSKIQAAAGRRGLVGVNEQVGCSRREDARKTLITRVASEVQIAWDLCCIKLVKLNGSDVDYLQVRRSTIGGQSQTLVNVAVDRGVVVEELRRTSAGTRIV